MATHSSVLAWRIPSLGFSKQEHWSGCNFLLQCMKVKSENEVAQSCPTLSDPMDCSPSGSSVQGIFQAQLCNAGVETLQTMLILPAIPS